MKRWPKGTYMKLNNRDMLRALIEHSGLSYQDIGTMAGCHRSMISQLVNGHRKSCTGPLAERISLCLGVPSELLFVAHVSAGSGSNDKRKAGVAA